MNSSPGTIGSSRPRTPSIRHAMIATQAMSLVVTLSKAGDSDDMARLRQLGNAAIAANLVPTGSARLFSGCDGGRCGLARRPGEDDQLFANCATTTARKRPESPMRISNLRYDGGIPPPSFVAKRVHRVGSRGLHRLQRDRDVSDREPREGSSDEDQRVDARAEREVLEPRFHHEIGEHARDHGRAEHEVDDPVREQRDDLARARAEHFANADLARALCGHEGREAEQAEARDEDAEPGENRYQAREPRVRDVELLERVVEKLEFERMRGVELAQRVA